MISEEHYNTKQVYGTLRLKYHLQNKYGVILNHKLIRRYKNYFNLFTITRKKRPLFIREQQKRNYYLAVPNQLNNNFTSINKFDKLSTDVSYINCTDGRLYLSAVKDLFNNEIISYYVSKRNDTSLIIESLKKVPFHKGVIHSDQGSIYLNNCYKQYMKKKGYKLSMSRKGACWENSPIENWFSQLKEEHLRPIGLKTKKETKEEIKKYIEWYNTQRIQKCLGYLPPALYQ
jgi:putative transposase